MDITDLQSAIAQLQAITAQLGTTTTELENVNLLTVAGSLSTVTASLQNVIDTYPSTIAALTTRVSTAETKLSTLTPMTSLNILPLIKAVDGNGSGIDTDLVRGKTPTTFGLSLLASADVATARTTLGLGSAATQASTAFLGASAQAVDSAKLGGTTPTTFGKSLIDDADAASARTTLGLGSAATQASTAFAGSSHSHSITIGTTAINTGASSLTLAGLTSVTATTFTGKLVGNVTGNVSGSSGSCTGNSATATNATNAYAVSKGLFLNSVTGSPVVHGTKVTAAFTAIPNYNNNGIPKEPSSGPSLTNLKNAVPSMYDVMAMMVSMYNALLKHTHRFSIDGEGVDAPAGLPGGVSFAELFGSVTPSSASTVS